MKFVDKIFLLNQTSLESLGLQSEKSIIKKFTDVGLKVLEADYAFCFMKEGSEDKFNLVYKDKNTPYIPKVPRGTGITVKAFKSKKPQFVTYTEQTDIIRADAKRMMKSVAVVPINYHKANYGVIDYCFRQRHEFSEEEKSLCEFIGNDVAQTITIYRLIEEKESALKEREQFLGLITHELKAPLTSMKIYAQHLLKSAEQKQANGLKLINEQVTRLGKLVNDILLFNKYKQDQLRLELKKSSVENMINESVNQMQSVIGSRKIVLDLEPNLFILGDAEKLEQVLINLISNAIKFSPPNSEIIITSRKMNDEVVVSVADQGMGVSKEEHNKIFERFYQATNTPKSGSGLGLYISKQIILQHKGRIWLESRVGKGSTFYFSIPLDGDLN